MNKLHGLMVENDLKLKGLVERLRKSKKGLGKENEGTVKNGNVEKMAELDKRMHDIEEKVGEVRFG